jgi:glycosyltransferase involved in cell wall biosynthesis
MGGKRSASVRRLYSASPPAGLTGGPVCALEHVSVLRPFFDEVCLVLCEPGHLEDRARAADVPVWCSPFVFRGLRHGGLSKWIQGLVPVVRSRWAYLRGLRRLLKDKPGILHIHSRAAHLPYALLAGRWAGVPVVVTIHEPWGGGLEARSELWLIRLFAQRVVFLTNTMQRQHPRLFGKRAAVVYNHCSLAPERRPPANPHPRVDLVARMSPAKGTDVFLQTCRRLREAGADFEAEMIGAWPTPEMRAAAESYIRDNQLGDVVSIRGPQTDMAPVYARMDILLLPTRRDSFPRVVMEAMCHGIPVVATRVDGIPEMVADGVTGFLVEPEDAEGFARSVERLLKDEALRRQMGKAGRERAQNLFSPEAYCERMNEIYRGWQEMR